MKTDTTALLKLLADPTRLHSLMLMLDRGELCVCELTYALGEIQPRISRHLAMLRDNNIVTDTRSGQWVYYRINPALPDWATAILTATRDGMASDARFNAIQKRLDRMPDRPENRICA